MPHLELGRTTTLLADSDILGGGERLFVLLVDFLDRGQLLDCFFKRSSNDLMRYCGGYANL
jgi:hypothetical protein